MRTGRVGDYPPEPIYATADTMRPTFEVAIAEGRRERERSATRLARLDTTHDRDHPAAVVHIAEQAVTVEVRDGALWVGVLVAPDERGVFRPGDAIPLCFTVEDAPVLTSDEHGVAHTHGWVREQLDAEDQASTTDQPATTREGERS